MSPLDEDFWAFWIRQNSGQVRKGRTVVSDVSEMTSIALYFHSIQAIRCLDDRHQNTWSLTCMSEWFRNLNSLIGDFTKLYKSTTWWNETPYFVVWCRDQDNAFYCNAFYCNAFHYLSRRCSEKRPYTWMVVSCQL